MAKDTTTTATTAETNEVQSYKAKVMRVLNGELLERNRVTIKTDATFPSFNKKGALEDTDSFSINSGQFFAVENEGFDDGEDMAIMLMGEPIRKQILALIATGAIIEFTRELLPVGYVNSKGQTITKPTYKTQLTKVVFDVDPKRRKKALQMFDENPVEPKKLVVADADDLF